MSIQEDLKKVILAGIGAVATTAEKSKDIVDTLVKKGELTVEQAKILNEELKRTSMKNPPAEGNSSPNSLLVQIDKLSPEEIQTLKAKLAEMETAKEEASDAAQR